jgi:TetR/AcrR family transcriptional regulator, mexJK operon transcriptional repressor
LRKDEDLCPACDGCPAKSPADMLREYAHQLYNHVTAPRAIALKRMAITEAIRDPDFARGIYEGIHLPSVRELAAIFERLNRESKAVIDDPMAASDLFFAIIMSDAQLQIMTAGESACLDEAAIDWRLAPFLSYFRFSEKPLSAA